VGHFPGPRAVLCQTWHPGEDRHILAMAVSQPSSCLEMLRQDQSRACGDREGQSIFSEDNPPPLRSARSLSQVKERLARPRASSHEAVGKHQLRCAATFSSLAD